MENQIPKSIRFSLAEKMRALLCLELSRSDETMDYELIFELSELITELDGFKAISKKSLSKRIDRILSSANTSKFTGKRFKVMLIAACMAALTALMAIFSLSFEMNSYETLKKYGRQIIEMFGNESVTVHNIEIHADLLMNTYSSIQTYLNEIDRTIYYPTKLPNNAEILKIYDQIESEKHSAIFEISDKSLNFSITFDSTDSPVFSVPEIDRVTINDFECYVGKFNDVIQCYFIDDNNTYYVRAATMEEIEVIVNNLERN